MLLRSGVIAFRNSLRWFRHQTWIGWLCVIGCLWLLIGCTTTRFLTQAAAGQWQLYRQGRPLQEVIHDPQTDELTRRFLQEVVSIKSFGSAHGLSMHENYEHFVQLDRKFVVWFVNASAPLAFYPKTFDFPIVGSFPGLSWFDEADARSFAIELQAAGWDVNVRGVSAYSTGGWFDDPVLSSMFSDEPAAMGLLANVVLHESLHATVLVENQQYFNESLASFVANELTPTYLVQRFGKDSVELRAYEETLLKGKVVVEILGDAFAKLNALYMSAASPEAKLAEKARIFHELQSQLDFETPPNNATLIGFALYHEGEQEMKQLRATCSSWPAFIKAVQSLRADDFPTEQSPAIGPVFDRLTRLGCQPLTQPPARVWSKPLRLKQRRQPHEH